MYEMPEDRPLPRNVLRVAYCASWDHNSKKCEACHRDRVQEEKFYELGDIMLAALDSRGPASLPASQNTPAPTATTFSTSNVAAPSEPESAPVSEPESEPESEPTSVPEPGPESEPESRVGGQTNKQPTITAAAGRVLPY